jgi:hypothetical protein
VVNDRRVRRATVTTARPAGKFPRFLRETPQRSDIGGSSSTGMGAGGRARPLRPGSRDERRRHICAKGDERVKFGILALDYDGTIATENGLDPNVRTAIGEARAAGVVVILVTGRRLAYLRADAGDLRFVEAVKRADPAMLDGHLRRGDFSRWFADVFGDTPLASQIRDLEHRYRLSGVADVNDALVTLVEWRYLTENGQPRATP